MKQTLIVFCLMLSCLAWGAPRQVQAAYAQSSGIQMMESAKNSIPTFNCQPVLLLAKPFTWVGDAVGEALSNVGKVFSGTARTVGDMVTTPFKIARNAVNAPLNLIKSTGAGVFDAGKKVINGAGNVITYPLKFTSNFLGEATKGIGEFVNKVGKTIKWILIIIVALITIPIILVMFVLIKGACKAVGGIGKAVSSIGGTSKVAHQPQIVVTAQPAKPESHGPGAVSFNKEEL